MIGQIRDEREIHSLRVTLIEHPEILLLGSANAFFEVIGGYGEPLYEFFRVFKLGGLGEIDAQKILNAVANGEGRPELSETLNREHARLETIRRLTRGNPRLLSLACRLLIESLFVPQSKISSGWPTSRHPTSKRELRSYRYRRARFSTVLQRDGGPCLRRRWLLQRS